MKSSGLIFLVRGSPGATSSMTAWNASGLIVSRGSRALICVVTAFQRLAIIDAQLFAEHFIRKFFVSVQDLCSFGHDAHEPSEHLRPFGEEVKV
jgi:hypothetical protein